MLRAPGTALAAACDVFAPNAEQAAKELSGGKARTFKDFRQLLEIKELDAVYVATRITGTRFRRCWLWKRASMSLSRSLSR